MTIGEIFTIIFYQPLLNLLVAFYHLLGDNLGIAIIAVTTLIRIIIFPLTKPSIELAKKQKELAPELKALKEKYKNRQVYAQKQMELYKKHGINPAAGCLPMIIQIVIFLVLYRVFTDLLNANGLLSEAVLNNLYSWTYTSFAAGESLKTGFLFYDLSAVDRTYSLPLLAAISQFFISKMMMKSSKVLKDAAKSTPDTTDDIMYNMQEGMIYMFPVMTFLIGITLPAGLSLYWFVSTLLQLVQYLILNKNKSIKPNTPEK